MCNQDNSQIVVEENLSIIDMSYDVLCINGSFRHLPANYGVLVHNHNFRGSVYVSVLGSVFD